MDIVGYSVAHRGAVDRLNAELRTRGSEWSFPPEERPRDADERPVWTESFVVVDGEDVYGGYILKHQTFFVAGEPVEVGNLQMPLSLGEVDSSFSHISVALLFDVLNRAPRIYSVGLGSEETQFARLLAAAGWQHLTVPFYFSVKSGNRFALNIELPPTRARVQRVLRALGHLRLGGAAARAQRIAAARSSNLRRPTYAHATVVDRFDARADDLFERHVASYALVGDRRAAALELLYPSSDARYRRLIVRRNGDAIGWALVLDTEMRDDKYFGNLRVGSIADCFGSHEEAAAIVAAADDYLTESGVDLVVSNQLHPVWCRGLEAAGYRQGPSNFFFYYSEALAERLAAQPDWKLGLHVNRGDGEGPGALL
jgi:hypothetical protein